jgi:hypothetical protein
MYISISYLNKTLKDRARAINQTNKENYSSLDSFQEGLSVGTLTGFVVVATIFFILEILVLFYCLQIVINCTKAGPERVVHIVLAIMFTLPYALFSVIFVPCAKKTLGKQE